MFLLDEPYISEFLLETLEKNKYKVLKTPFSEKFSQKYNLNLANDMTFSDDEIFYTNSENSITWILNHFKNTKLVESINICKNKRQFRETLQPLYPDFYFQEVSINELKHINTSLIKFPVIIKPTVGFLSIGVHKINDSNEFKKVISKIENESKEFSKLFPEKVLNSSNFIIEEIIQGKEYAVDAYFNKNGKPIVLNIFEHPFENEKDVRDRIYITSQKIIKEKLEKFTKTLAEIGKVLGFRNFPIHIEFIENQQGKVIPVEINPLRFAGWCTTDLAFYAYKINNYEHFSKQIEPNWKEILDKEDNAIYYFAMMEVPSNINKNEIKTFDYHALKQEFSNILEFRQIDYKEKPLFSILFGKTNSDEEVKRILQIQTEKYIN